MLMGRQSPTVAGHFSDHSDQFLNGSCSPSHIIPEVGPQLAKGRKNRVICAHVHTSISSIAVSSARCGHVTGSANSSISEVSALKKVLLLEKCPIFPEV